MKKVWTNFPSRILFCISFVALSASVFCFSFFSRAENIKVLKSQDDEMRVYMVNITRQLGTTCTTCHNTDNFRSDLKREFQISKEHIKLTQLLIDHGMDGKKGPKADCYMCHRGQLKPDFKEKVHPMQKTD